MKSERFKEATYIDNKNIGYFLKEYYNLDLYHKKIIAAGGFGKLFKLTTKDEQVFALKSFYSEFHYAQTDPDERVSRRKSVIEEYVDNIHLNYNEYKNEFIVQLLNSKYGSPIARNSYLMEYVCGENLQSLMTSGELYDSKQYTKEDLGIILLNYVQMLKKLHDKNYLFLDVDWNSVFYDEQNKKIIVTDIDSIASLDRINKVKVESDPFVPGEKLIYRPWFIRFGKIQYKNGDIHKMYDEDETNLVTLTFNSELQSFALMADTLLHGSTFMEHKFPKEGKLVNWLLGDFLCKGEIFGESIQYTRDRYKSIPKNLRILIRDMLQINPEQHTADDFISAIKADYKL